MAAHVARLDLSPSPCALFPVFYFSLVKCRDTQMPERVTARGQGIKQPVMLLYSYHVTPISFR